MKNLFSSILCLIILCAAGLQNAKAQTLTGNDSFVYIELKDFSNFQENMAAHAKKAKEAGLKPFVYYTATWCPPCQSIKKYHNDPAMQDAYVGTYIIALDFDLMDKHTLPEAYDNGTWPTWMNLLDNGLAGDHLVDGGEWDANIPENMAPVLKSYFQWEGDWMDWYPPGK